MRESAKAKLRGLSRSTIGASIKDGEGSDREDPEMSLEQLQSKLASQASYIEVNRNV